MPRRKSLLRSLFAPKKTKKRVATKAASPKKPTGWRYKANVAPIQTVEIPNIEPFVVPEGEWEQHVYIYDGRPLKGTRKGSRFMLDVIPGTHTMTSVYTGGEWESEYTVAYDGQLIGHVGDGTIANHLVELVRRHGRVIVHAKRMGTHEGGWPVIEMLVPHGRKGDPEKDWLQIAE